MYGTATNLFNKHYERLLFVIGPVLRCEFPRLHLSTALHLIE